MIPVALFKATVEGKEYTVLAGEFGAAWVILNKWEISSVVTSPAPPPAPSPTP